MYSINAIDRYVRLSALGAEAFPTGTQVLLEKTTKHSKMSTILLENAINF